MSGLRQLVQDIIKLFEVIKKSHPGGRRAAIAHGYKLNIREKAIGVDLRKLTGDTEEGVHTKGCSNLRDCCQHAEDSEHTCKSFKNVRQPWRKLNEG